jgi:hypothetical protein
MTDQAMPDRPAVPAMAASRPGETVMTDQALLAKRLAPLGAPVADLVQRPNTEVRQLDTPFLQRGHIYRVTHRAPHRPVVFTAGWVEPDFAVMLPLNPQGFAELATRAGLRLDTADGRAQYVTTFLETTRDFRFRFDILRRFADIQLVPRATAEQQGRYDRLRREYEEVLKPPAFAGDGPWKGTVFVLKGQDLVRLDVTLCPEGKVEIAEKVLEKDLPIPYAR